MATRTHTYVYTYTRMSQNLNDTQCLRAFDWQAIVIGLAHSIDDQVRVNADVIGQTGKRQIRLFKQKST